MRSDRRPPSGGSHRVGQWMWKLGRVAVEVVEVGPGGMRMGWETRSCGFFFSERAWACPSDGLTLHISCFPPVLQEEAGGVISGRKVSLTSRSLICFVQTKRLSRPAKGLVRSHQLGYLLSWAIYGIHDSTRV